LFSSMIERCL